MQDSNRILAEEFTSQERSVKEFQRYILIRHSVTFSNMGRMKNIGAPVDNNFAIWGRIRTTKRIEQERISGVYDNGALVFEYDFPMGTYIPQIGDYIEAHGVANRQPRQRFLIKEIFPDSSIKIGKCIITPIGKTVPSQGS